MNTEQIEISDAEAACLFIHRTSKNENNQIYLGKGWEAGSKYKEAQLLAQITQLKAENEKKDALLADMAAAIEATDKELASRFHRDYEQAFNLMSEDLKKVVSLLRISLTRYNQTINTK